MQEKDIKRGKIRNKKRDKKLETKNGKEYEVKK